jgi:hypothetical protein
MKCPIPLTRGKLTTFQRPATFEMLDGLDLPAYREDHTTYFRLRSFTASPKSLGDDFKGWLSRMTFEDAFQGCSDPHNGSWRISLISEGTRTGDPVLHRDKRPLSFRLLAGKLRHWSISKMRTNI